MKIINKYKKQDKSNNIQNINLIYVNIGLEVKALVQNATMPGSFPGREPQYFFQVSVYFIINRK